MPKNPRLFDVSDLARAERQHPTRRHLYLAGEPSEQMRFSPDGAGLVPGRSDGLPVRLVKPHSAEKARTVSRDLGTVGRAMNRKFFDIHYLELFSGPGYLLDDLTREEVPGSPLQALTIPKPFANYVFSDFSDVCTDALERRIAAMRREGLTLPPTTVLRGDANDPEHLELACSKIDRRALVIAYLDPAKPNLHWSTVEYLANRFRFIDLIINLPFSGIHRSLSAGGDERPRLMLNHQNPKELLHPEEGRTAQNIRDWYDKQLRSLGLHHIARRCVKTQPTNSPLYDVVLASRHEAAVKLFERANPVPKVEAPASLFELQS